MTPIPRSEKTLYYPVPYNPCKLHTCPTIRWLWGVSINPTSHITLPTTNFSVLTPLLGTECPLPWHSELFPTTLTDTASRTGWRHTSARSSGRAPAQFGTTSEGTWTRFKKISATFPSVGMETQTNGSRWGHPTSRTSYPQTGDWYWQLLRPSTVCEEERSWLQKLLQRPNRKGGVGRHQIGLRFRLGGWEGWGWVWLNLQVMSTIDEALEPEPFHPEPLTTSAVVHEDSEVKSALVRRCQVLGAAALGLITLMLRNWWKLYLTGWDESSPLWEMQLIGGFEFMSQLGRWKWYRSFGPSMTDYFILLYWWAYGIMAGWVGKGSSLRSGLIMYLMGKVHSILGTIWVKVRDWSVAHPGDSPPYYASMLCLLIK